MHQAGHGGAHPRHPILRAQDLGARAIRLTLQSSILLLLHSMQLPLPPPPLTSSSARSGDASSPATRFCPTATACMASAAQPAQPQLLRWEKGRQVGEQGG